MSARVGWLVQELEEENSSLQAELKGIQDERDLLRREVDEQRRLLKNCVEEVFALKEELTRLLATHCPPAEAQRQQKLCERLARHVTEIERDVAEKGARAAQWRAEKEQREAALAELEASLERQQQEARRLAAELDRARTQAGKQAEDNQKSITVLENEVDSLTKEKDAMKASHAKEVDQLKKSINDAEASVKTASASQQQLIAARREQDRLARQLAALTERTNQLAEARRSVEVKAAQVIGLKSTRQKSKLEEVAKDLNKLKSVFSDQDLPGLCECNEVMSSAAKLTELS
ncbi:stress response protein nst1-like [Pollicipes pollicipes]|uniref:stress response protein nst1-like n=1 Tax=Pollicipes pollicipes TaxID=41117 RepID=UPI0018859BF0|nr:stress response protein nst1-like [Pollicipes pollicipes]